MFVISKEDFKKDFFEYFEKNNDDFNDALNKLEDKDFIEMYFLDIDEPPDVEAWEGYVRFRAVVNDKYKLESDLIIYNTFSIFGLILCNLSDQWINDI